MQDVEVQLESPPQGRPDAPQLDDCGFTHFAIAGAEVSGEFRCCDCGYGAVVHRGLPPCPMCGGTVWESRPPRFVD